MSDCTRMGYEWSFGSQPYVNGSAIKDIRINGKLPDEVYCNGKLVGKVKKDVSVSGYRCCLSVTRRWTETWETDAEYDSCGFLIKDSVPMRTYYAECQYYARIAVSGLDTPGKRISKIEWGKYDGKKNFKSGTINLPEYRNYYIPTSVRTEDLKDEEDTGTEDWNFNFSVKHHFKTEATVTFTDGTSQQAKDGSHSDTNTRFHGLSPSIGFYNQGTSHYTISKRV